MTREHPPERISPPQRRPSELFDTSWEGHPLKIGISHYPETGEICEVFADTKKGGQMQATLDDACTLISLGLQYGLTIPQLAKSLSRVPDLAQGGDATLPASPVGAILDALGAEIAANAEGGA